MHLHPLATFPFLIVASLFPVSSDAQESLPVAKLLTRTAGVTLHRAGQEQVVKGAGYVFEGDRLSAGKSDSFKLIYLESGKVFNVSSDTAVILDEAGPRRLGSVLQSADEEDNSLLAMLRWKLRTHQRFVAVRRDNLIQLPLPSSFTLCDAYPEIVWSNLANNVSYLVIVDGRTITKVPPSDEHVLRVAIPRLEPGEHALEIITEGTGRTATTTSRIRWLTLAEEQAVLRSLNALRAKAWQDQLLEALLLESHDLNVAAYRLYNRYFAEGGDPRLLPVRKEIDARLRLL